MKKEHCLPSWLNQELQLRFPLVPFPWCAAQMHCHSQLKAKQNTSVACFRKRINSVVAASLRQRVVLGPDRLDLFGDPMYPFPGMRQVLLRCATVQINGSASFQGIEINVDSLGCQTVVRRPIDR